MKTLTILFAAMITLMVIMPHNINAQTVGGWTVSYSEMDSIKFEIQPFAVQGNNSMNIKYWSNNPNAIFRMKKSFENLPWSNELSWSLYKAFSISGADGSIKPRFIKNDSIAISTTIWTNYEQGQWGNSGGPMPFSDTLSSIDFIEFEFGFLFGQSGFNDFNIDYLQQRRSGTDWLIDSFGDDGNIQGTVWYDINNDSSQNISEPGLAGWKVYLLRASDGQLLDSTLANSLGSWSFESRSQESYLVTTASNSCWQTTYPAADTHYVTLSPTCQDTTVDFGTYAPNARQYQTQARWNILSVPQEICSALKQTVYPTAISNAFYYHSWLAYQRLDTLRPGIGFWLKFPEETEYFLAGTYVDSLSIPLHEGWNLIGALSQPLLASQAVSEPPELLISPFYGYNSSYQEADTLLPAKGYWIKSSGEGYLILDVSASISQQAFAKIISNELPPPAPGEDGIASLPLEATSTKFKLGQNYPNPFNPMTVITYAIPNHEAGSMNQELVTLKVFNLLGQEVATLVNETQPPGNYSVQWNSSNNPSGMYFYKLQAGNNIETKKLLLLK